MLADYLVVRKRTLKIEHLYIGDSRSIYWYKFGIHWRAVVAWALGTWPTFPGFVMTLRNPLTTSNWANLFKISFLVGSSTTLIFVFQTSGLSPPCTGVSISFVSFLVICTISPPPHLGEGLNYLVSNDSVLYLG
jgi:NCS1 family nucleobase:cation symporter-1